MTNLHAQGAESSSGGYVTRPPSLGRMRVRPVSPRVLVSELVEACTARRGRVRVAIDGAPGTGTGQLADDLVSPLRALGREAVRVPMDGYVRPASLRLEHGHQDPDSYYAAWFDHAGLRREVLDPARSSGTGSVLPALWDVEADRSPRRQRVVLPDDGIVLVDGPFLLGAGLDFEVTVHLWVAAAALARLVPANRRWTLPAFARYAEEVRPETVADHLIRADHSDRPAIVDSLV